MVKQSYNISKIVCIRDKFNITIPQKIREIIDIEIGDHIQFLWDGNGGIRINKVIPQVIEVTRGEGGNGNKESCSPSSAKDKKLPA